MVFLFLGMYAFLLYRQILQKYTKLKIYSKTRTATDHFSIAKNEIKVSNANNLELLSIKNALMLAKEGKVSRKTQKVYSYEEFWSIVYY